AEIRRRLMEDRAYGGWDHVLCPPEWGLSDAAPRPLDSFFSRQLLKQSRRWQLQELRLNVLRLALFAAVFAGLSLAGIWGWHSYREHQQIADARVLAQRQQAERATEERDAPVPMAPVPPWPLLPRPADFAEACVAAFA